MSEVTGANAIIVACISAVATLGAGIGAAYIGKLDFNREHQGVEQRISDLDAQGRQKDDALAAAKQMIATPAKETGHEPADTCQTLLADKAREGSSREYRIELTMHRETAALVTYSAGSVKHQADGSFTGSANQIFSDRLGSDGQPFASSKADQLDVLLSPTGLLHLHYKPWNFDTDWTLTCRGSLMTAYLPNFGVVTLTFRD